MENLHTPNVRIRFELFFGELRAAICAAKKLVRKVLIQDVDDAWIECVVFVWHFRFVNSYGERMASERSPIKLFRRRFIILGNRGLVFPCLGLCAFTF